MRKTRFRRWSGLLVLLLAMLAVPAEAQMRGFGGRGMGEQPRPGAPSGGLVEQRDNDVRETGLTPVFPEGYACAPITSPFASPRRYDGSSRRGDRNEGLHGGMDLTLKQSTPLLAVAAAKVIGKGEGGQLEGNHLWLQHAPADTDLPFWSYTKYQHLADVPALNEGDPVRLGAVVGRSGNTGTIGGQYCAAAYSNTCVQSRTGSTCTRSVSG